MASKIGEERVSPNGYRYVKTEDGWQLKHKVIMEQILKRKLRPGERVRYKDGDRTNLDPNNLTIVPSKGKSPAARKARILSKIEDLQQELVEIEEEIRGTTHN